jgi:uroporphyrinogen-III synthase
MLSNRKHALYLGVDPTHFKTDKEIVHMPLIKIVRRQVDSKELIKVFEHILDYSHIVFTSKSSVRIFLAYIKRHGHVIGELQNKHIIAIGRITAFYLKNEGLSPSYIAADETEEGVVKVLAALDLTSAFVLLPKSSAPRAQLIHFLVEHEVRHQICVLYDALEEIPEEPIDLELIDEVVFTNPLTVDVFFSLYPEIPSFIKLHPLGNITREALRAKLKKIQLVLEPV